MYWCMLVANIYVATITKFIDAGTSLAGPAVARTFLRRNYAFDCGLVTGRVHKCAHMKITFSMAKLPDLPEEPHQPAFPKESVRPEGLHGISCGLDCNTTKKGMFFHSIQLSQYSVALSPVEVSKVMVTPSL